MDGEQFNLFHNKWEKYGDLSLDTVEIVHLRNNGHVSVRYNGDTLISFHCSLFGYTPVQNACSTWYPEIDQKVMEIVRLVLMVHERSF